ncbi:ankyrin repeat domain-containing protein [Streptomyces cavourensis]
MNALDHALLTTDTDGVRTAIAGGARVDARDEELRTPLLLAALGDHVEAARLLVAAGADPDAQDRREDSPWLVTGVTGSVAMLEVLLAAGASPGLPDGDGVTALAHAERRGFAEIAALLRAAA